MKKQPDGTKLKPFQNNRPFSTHPHAIKKRVRTGMRLAVGLYEPLVVVVDGAGHARPGLGYTQSAGRVGAALYVPLREKKKHYFCDNNNTTDSVRAKL